jgi:ABC-type branched-subunit amino acid transport system ATPase component
MMAAFAGYFYGGLLVNFGDTKNFAPELSLALVGLVILGGVTTITGAVLGALWLQGLGYVLAPLLPGLLGANIAVLLGGVGLLGALLTFPGGISEPAFALRDRILQAILHRPLEQLGGGDEAARTGPRLLPKEVVPAPAGEPPVPVLVAENIVVRFGGNLAVDHVSLNVNEGEIVGLVGPNGAGKTTLFDVLTGQIRPASGRVILADEDITRMRPEQRAWLGLGRTFQQARLYDGLALVDAFKVALEREDPSEIMPSVLGLLPARRSERNKTLRAGDLLDLLGLRAVAHRPIAELSTGTRRMAELGCLIALGADVLLLDEPTAGIAQREVEAFRPVIRDIRDHLGATMVVVEHDIPLIMGLVDRLYVLNAGKMLAEGKPAILRDDPAVVAAYLGTDERVIRRSGEAASMAAVVGVTAP